LQIKDILLSEFTLKKAPGDEFLRLAELASSDESVSIHVRRGDYISNERIFNVHGVCPPDYFRLAITEVMNRVENPRFFIFSDEIKWVKANLELPMTSVFISENRSIKDHEELILMSKCSHNIISNSSFSWWGAWLNQRSDKIVIAPQKWFSDPALDPKDIVPPQWMKI
jgi:Glycosyl transferase family 11